jgi:hypothetical protein
LCPADEKTQGASEGLRKGKKNNLELPKGFGKTKKIIWSFRRASERQKK